MRLFGTGHRSDKLGGWDEKSPLAEAVKLEVRRELLRLEPESLICGMALGFDMWFAEAGLALGVPFDAYLPFEGQELKWPVVSQQRYRVLLRHARSTFIVSPGGYEPWKMQARNMRMVDDGDEGLACYNGSRGGTHNCVVYALSKGKTLHIIDPRKLE